MQPKWTSARDKKGSAFEVFDPLERKERQMENLIWKKQPKTGYLVSHRLISVEAGLSMLLLYKYLISL